MTDIGWLLSDGPSDARAEEARLAEELGFDAVVGGAGAAGPPSWARAVADLTTRIRIVAVGTPILGRGPEAFAEEAARLSEPAGGRLTIGVGTGDAAAEDPTEGRLVPNWERMGRLQEAIPIVRALLRGERVDVDTAYHHLEGATLRPPPGQPPPVWMLADGPSSAGMAARFAEGLIVEVDDPAAALADVVEPFRAAAPPDALVATLVRAEPGAEVDTVARLVEMIAPDLVAIGVPGPDPLASARAAASALLPEPPP